MKECDIVCRNFFLNFSEVLMIKTPKSYLYLFFCRLTGCLLRVLFSYSSRQNRYGRDRLAGSAFEYFVLFHCCDRIIDEFLDIDGTVIRYRHVVPITVKIFSCPSFNLKFKRPN